MRQHDFPRIPSLRFFLALWLPAIPLFAETVQLSQSAEAYDPAHPASLIGRFQPQSSLEVDDYVEAAGMFRVRFKLPNGTEVTALCRPADLGKSPPLKAPVETKVPHPVPSDTTKHDPGHSEEPNKATSSGPPPIFTSILQFDPDIWKTSSSQFALKHSSFGFRWVSQADNNTSRSPAPLSFLQIPVYETIARFKEGTFDDISLLLYGRGDSKQELDEASFQSTLKGIEGALDQWTQGRGLDAWIPGNATDTKRKSWFKTPLRIDLEWSISRNVTEGSPLSTVKKNFRPEFIRIAISTYDGRQDTAQLVKPNYSARAPTSIKRAELKERVKRESGGDTYLDSIPMVDQGQKGYCVVASTERLMRYYGLDIDQNEIAKTANTDAEGGTTPDGMFKALKRLGGQFSLAVRALKTFEFEDFYKETDAYNKLAKHEKKETIYVPQSGLIPIGEIYGSMDPVLLKQIRLKKVNEKTKFLGDITDSIDKGAPLLWAVQLGMVPETPALRQARGGHLRLIIGYNKKDGQLIYSDSWGSGHEFKKMSMDDAFFITGGLFSVLPAS